MPRNPEKNVYITIAIARTSATWKHLQREATDMGISVADLIKVFLADYIAALDEQDKQQRLPREAPAARSSLPLERTERSPEPIKDDASRRAASAASAASYWDD